MKKNVLLISPKSNNAKGGIAVWTETYLSHCEGVGIHCDLVNTMTIGERAKNLTAKRNFLDEYKRTRSIFKSLKQCLKQNNIVYDFAHLNTSCGKFGLIRDYLIAKQLKKHNIPIILHFHCDIPFWVKTKVGTYFLKKLLAISYKRLVLCENSKIFLEKEFSSSSVKIPNFLDEKMIADKPKTINENIKKIFFVGRISVSKGVKEIFELASMFPEYDFELVGEMDEMIINLPRTDNVKFIGVVPHSDIIKYLDESDVFLFPSHTEGFSLALMESMARGVPAIATDVGANKDMLGDGCGIVVPCKNVTELAKALLDIKSFESRLDFSKNAMKKARNTFAVNRVMEFLNDKIYQ